MLKKIQHHIQRFKSKIVLMGKALTVWVRSMHHLEMMVGIGVLAIVLILIFVVAVQSIGRKSEPTPVSIAVVPSSDKPEKMPKSKLTVKAKVEPKIDSNVRLTNGQAESLTKKADIDSPVELPDDSTVALASESQTESTIEEKEVSSEVEKSEDLTAVKTADATAPAAAIVVAPKVEGPRWDLVADANRRLLANPPADETERQWKEVEWALLALRHTTNPWEFRKLSNVMPLVERLTTEAPLPEVQTSASDLLTCYSKDKASH